MEEKTHCKWYNDEFCTNDKSPCVADYCPVVEYPELCKCREEGSEKEKTKRKKILANRIYSDSTLKGWKKEDLIEQIRILEHNWAAAEESLNNSAKNSEKLLAEQKAEIERLTREYERIAYNKQEYLEWVDGFLRTHTVMKDRGEAYKMFDREWMCNTFWAKIEGSLDYIIDLENQRRELQKQVDELKEELDKEYELRKKYLFSCEQKDLEIKYLEINKQQAEKDTAKEIIKWIKLNGLLQYGGYVIHDSTLEQIGKKYGVEVE